MFALATRPLAGKNSGLLPKPNDKKFTEDLLHQFSTKNLNLSQSCLSVFNH